MTQTNSIALGLEVHLSIISDTRLRGAMVARLTPDQKAACSSHVGVKYFTLANLSINKSKQKVPDMPRPGFEPGLLRPQRRVLTTRRSRLHTGDGL